MAGISNTIIVDFDYLQENSSIYANLDPADINWIIPVSQDVNLERLIGTALYTKIKTDIQNNALAGAYKTLVDDYLSPALVYYIVLDAVEFNAIKFTNKGMLRKSSDDSDVASPEEIQSYKNKISTFAEHYGNKTVNYLCANMGDFPEYNQNNNQDDVNPARSGFTSTIYIPGRSSQRRTYDRPEK